MKTYKLVCRSPEDEILRIAYGDTPKETWEDEERQKGKEYYSGYYFYRKLINGRYEPCHAF